ncbi:L,D-transpeptidase family protein [Allorhodopirellula solitaria]|uniref:L,D-transpeptidase catalytic domain n=1 Tax=Allorhodopirellula solitaria TaxID=2527987 RepID=A0A5C5YHG9_9BACT|nr:L,D-transpeptidase family protein [Allorhodopirellula solitaria]TWT74125.1 L,D-transpeptidase catalytic domain [Allorhodopirellula solitaria]
MQTLKTSAIVVLMMTVLYGAYVSMTTPPDSLPPGLQSVLVESENSEFSDGLPDDFADFGIDTGTPEGMGDSPMASGMLGPPMDPADPAQHGPGRRGNPGSLGGPGDRANNDALAGPGGPPETPSFQLSDVDVNDELPPVASRLPVVAAGESASVAADPNRQYPSTGSSFSLPDPNETAEMGLPESLDNAPQSPENTSSPATDTADAGLANAIATADRQFQEDRRREALATLSLFYETPNLSQKQREQLLSRLDPLARDVIYSSEHLLEEPHRVGGNETLMDIAKKYDVPWQLLANINGVSDPVTVLPGTDLKVVRGPFRADVDLENHEMTLFLGDLYAGRFPVGIGSDPSPRTGSYTIQEKKSAKTYYDMAGTPVPPGNPRNPYGSMWIDLGQGISLHGSPQNDEATDQGCISIAGNYSRDVFGILSEGSSVTIR